MKPLPELLRCLHSAAQVELFRWRARRTIHVVRRRDGAAGFAGVGDAGAHSWFMRRYLGEMSRPAVAVSSTWRSFGMAGQIGRLTRELGLVAMDPWAVPPALQAETLAFDLWTHLTIPLPASADQFVKELSHSAFENLRLIRKQGYRLETSDSSASVGEFYESFHRPSIQGRHGDEGLCSEPNELAQLLAQKGAEWIRIIRSDECVAMALGRATPSGYKLCRLGWRNGDPALLKAGVVAAIYWFGICRTRDLGLSQVLLGTATSSLEDGLFSYKTAWGGRLLPGQERIASKRLLIDPAHPAARRFLEKHSLLIRGADDRFIVLSSRRPAEVPAYRGQSAFIAAWFRLRPSPLPAVAHPASPLPVSLRRWFEPEPLPGAN